MNETMSAHQENMYTMLMVPKLHYPPQRPVLSSIQSYFTNGDGDVGRKEGVLVIVLGQGFTVNGFYAEPLWTNGFNGSLPPNPHQCGIILQMSFRRGQDY